MLNKHHLLLLTILVAVMIDVTFASNSRIEAMGKNEDFFIDDMSMFKNPANMVLYPTYLFGELGTVFNASEDTTGREGASDQDSPFLAGRDPYDPWFGGIYSYTLLIGGGAGDVDENQIKRATLGISLGAAFNRTDKAESILNSFVDEFNESVMTDTIDVEKPINEFDILLGFKSRRQFGIGLGIYHAGYTSEDKIIQNSKTNTRKSGITSLKFGVNKLFTSNSFLDIYLNIDLYKYEKNLNQWDPIYNLTSSTDLFERMGIDFRFRTFIQTSKPIQIIPLVKANMMNFVVNEESDVFWGSGQFGGGLGLGINHNGPSVEFNVGFCLNMLRTNDYTDIPDLDTLYGVEQNAFYSEINFGIEKRMRWDWLYFRAGAKKVVGISNRSVFYGNQKDIAESKKSFTNADANGSLEDLIGIGLGVNVQNHLKIDFTIAEDLPYRFGHLFSGLEGTVSSRVSVSYKF